MGGGLSGQFTANRNLEPLSLQCSPAAGARAPSQTQTPTSHAGRCSPAAARPQLPPGTPQLARSERAANDTAEPRRRRRHQRHARHARAACCGATAGQHSACTARRAGTLLLKCSQHRLSLGTPCCPQRRRRQAMLRCLCRRRRGCRCAPRHTTAAPALLQGRAGLQTLVCPLTTLACGRARARTAL